MNKKWKVIIVTMIVMTLFYTTYSLTGYEKLSTLEQHMKKVELSEENRIKYIQGGEQTQLSDAHVVLIESEIEYSDNPMELLRNIYEWKGSRIKTKHAQGKYIGKRTIDEILNEMTSTGCHDDGMIISSILRHYQIPCIMVDTVGIHWIQKFNNGKIKMHNGHVFVEVFYEDNCFLFDSTLGKVVVGYDPENEVIPTTLRLMDSEGFYTLYKGVDPLDYGITSVRKLNDELEAFAKASEGKKFEIPDYQIISLKKIDFEH